jgi:iron complex outermembrane receptor protein
MTRIEYCDTGLARHPASVLLVVTLVVCLVLPRDAAPAPSPEAVSTSSGEISRSSGSGETAPGESEPGESEVHESESDAPEPHQPAPRKGGTIAELRVPAARSAPVEVEEIVTTGTRLPSTYTATGPITTLTAEALQLSSAASLAEALEDSPSVDFSGLRPEDTNGGRARSTVGLRGLGPERVLILVDGYRLVSSSSGVRDAVDLANIPVKLVQSVDILRDGASTIYGSDAVAGVINIKTRRFYDGFELFLDGGATEEGDGSRGEAGFIFGRNFSRGNVTLYGSLDGFEPVKITDRSFSRSPVLAASFGPDGDVVLTRDVVSIPQGAVPIRNFLDPNDPVDVVGFEPGPNGESFAPFDLRTNGRSVNDDLYLTGEGYRSSLSGTFDFALRRGVELFGQATYVRRDGKQRIPSSGLSPSGTPANPAGFTFPIFRRDDPLSASNSPFLPPDFVDFAFRESGLAGVPLEVLQQIPQLRGLPISVFRQLDELGPRVFQNEVRTLRTVLGVRGELPLPLDPLAWEVYVNYGRSHDVESTENDVNLTRALASVQPALCAQTPGCALGDFFGDGSLLGTPDAFEFIRFKSEDRLLFHMRQAGLTARTTLARLPAGDLRLALGGEYREEDGSVSVDAVTLAGDGAGLGRGNTRGRQLVREAFFEADIPLVADVPGLKDLRVNASGRYTDYSTFGGRYLSRYALSFTPVESLLVRGVYSTSFRAPSISDLFLGRADSAELLIDPCTGFPNLPEPLRSRCAAVLPAERFTAASPFDGNLGTAGRVVTTNVGGNRALEEETATSVSVGFVYQPAWEWLRGVRLAVDYFDVEIADPIVGQTAQTRVNNCLLSGVLSECDATRRGVEGVIDFVDSPRTNFGKFRTNGLDVSAQYTTVWPVLGRMLFEVQGIYTFDFEFESFGDKGKANGRIGVQSGLNPNAKWLFSIVSSPRSDLRIELDAIYLGEAEISPRASLGLPLDDVSDVVYLNVGFRYDVTEQLSLGLTVRNATDKQPPLVVGSIINTNGSYDVLGRRASLSLRLRF